MTQRSAGFVWLVGAGPGDPDLLTLRALRVLQQADLILYDALVSAEVLELAPRAQRFFVGKRAGRPSIEQHAIERLLIRAARRGKRVVRLKCGDPFVFGRGGEEMLALAAAGVPFEVVPGLTSAVAAPTLAGIPVTHRGVASAFLVISGHAASAYSPLLRSVQPNSLTLVVLMGIAERASLAAFLIGLGWNGDTPAAIAVSAATPQARTWTGTLSGLSAADPSPGPGTIVIGEVVTVAETAASAAVLEPAAAARGS
jgi:uroporphyrin-III C-methyltransferase/precorrin-2 dehydrogenase/sirohydrochlorin ferrochelatase